MTKDYSYYLSIAKEAVLEGSKVIRDAKFDFFDVKSSHADLVTVADEKSQNIIFSTINKNFPNHKLIGEETFSSIESPELTDEPTWIIDPLDGTTNFIHRFDYYSISIALLIKKMPVVGVVYNCLTNDMYEATKGNGSYCNGEKINVSNQKVLKGSLVVTEWGSNRVREVVDSKSLIMNLLINDGYIHGIRSCGSAALNMCLVAKGSFDIYYEWGIFCWDIAAGSLIVQEAGGYLSLLNGDDFDIMKRQIVAVSHKCIIDNLVNYLSHAKF